MPIAPIAAFLHRGVRDPAGVPQTPASQHQKRADDLSAAITAHLNKRFAGAPPAPATGEGPHLRGLLKPAVAPAPAAPAPAAAKPANPPAAAPAKPEPKPELTLADHAKKHGFGHTSLFGGGHLAWIPTKTYNKIKHKLPLHSVKMFKDGKHVRVHTKGPKKAVSESSMSLITRICDFLGEAVAVMRAGWDAPAKSLEAHGEEHHFEVHQHPKGGHVALVPKHVYAQIRHRLPPHAAGEFGNHMRVRTAGKREESIEESFGKGSWRSPGGKFASIHKRGGAIWQPHQSSKLKERVKALGGKMKPVGTGGAMAIVFESHEKALAARTALMSEGWRVRQHDIPGVLFVQGRVDESVIAARHEQPAYRHTVVRAALSEKADCGPLTATWDRFRSAAILAGAGAVHILANERAYTAHFWSSGGVADLMSAHALARTARLHLGDFVENATLSARVVEDAMPGGKGDDRPDTDFDADQLKMGVKVEMEHTRDADKAKEIAKDHLSEDPAYYTKLKDAGLADELGEAEVAAVTLPDEDVDEPEEHPEQSRKAAKAAAKDPSAKHALHVGYSKWSVRMSDSLHRYIGKQYGAKYQYRDAARGADVYHLYDDAQAKGCSDYLRSRGHAAVLSKPGEEPAVHTPVDEKKFQPFTGVPKLSDVVHVAKKLGAEVSHRGGDVLLYHPSWGEKLRIHAVRGDATKEIVHHVNRMIKSTNEGFAAKITAALTPQVEAVQDESFTKVFSDEDEAEDTAHQRSTESPNSTPAYVLALADGKYVVHVGQEAHERLAAGGADIHSIYIDGEEVMDDDQEDDENVHERHSVRSKMQNQQARKGLAGGHLARNKNARQSARARRRRGSIYAAKKAARKALHHPDSH